MSWASWFVPRKGCQPKRTSSEPLHRFRTWCRCWSGWHNGEKLLPFARAKNRDQPYLPSQTSPKLPNPLRRRRGRLRPQRSQALALPPAEPPPNHSGQDQKTSQDPREGSPPDQPPQRGAAATAHSGRGRPTSGTRPEAAQPPGRPHHSLPAEAAPGEDGDHHQPGGRLGHPQEQSSLSGR